MPTTHIHTRTTNYRITPATVRRAAPLGSHQRMHCTCLDQRSRCRTGLVANNTVQCSAESAGTPSFRRARVTQPPAPSRDPSTYTVRPPPSSCQARSSTPWSRYKFPNTPQLTVQWHCHTCRLGRDCSCRPSRSCCTAPLDTATLLMLPLPHCTRTQHSHCRHLSSWMLPDLWHCRRRLVDTACTRPECRC